MPVESTISVTTSDYETIITDVVRGESGVTPYPTTAIFDVVKDAVWWSERHKEVEPEVDPEDDDDPEVDPDVEGGSEVS